MRALDLLAIKELNEWSGNELFEALTSGISLDDGENGGVISLTLPQPLQIQSVRPAFPLDIWNQQTDALAKQSAFLTQIQESIEMKLDKLPVGENSQSFIARIVSSLLEDWGIESFMTGLRLLLKWLSGLGGGFSAILAFVMCLGFFELKDLWDRLTQGKETCTQMFSENTALESLTIYGEEGLDSNKAWDYYQLRESVIVRHQRDIHNLLTEMIAMEERTTQAIGQPTGDMSELIQAVKDLQFNGLEFVYKDGSKYILEGATPSGND